MDTVIETPNGAVFGDPSSDGDAQTGGGSKPADRGVGTIKPKS